MPAHEPRAGLALRFLVLAVSLLSLAGILATVLPTGNAREPSAPAKYPPAFLVSTLFLCLGSVCLLQAKAHVARERQIPFRTSLCVALMSGTLFITVQCYALSNFFRQQPHAQAATGATAFIAVAAALHGMHFLIAWLFLLYVVLQSQRDRYDHEYHRGVTFCGWFWHVLGIVWLLVLAVIVISRPGLIDDGVMIDTSTQ